MGHHRKHHRKHEERELRKKCGCKRARSLFRTRKCEFCFPCESRRRRGSRRWGESRRHHGKHGHHGSRRGCGCGGGCGGCREGCFRAEDSIRWGSWGGWNSRRGKWNYSRRGSWGPRKLKLRVHQFKHSRDRHHF